MRRSRTVLVAGLAVLLTVPLMPSVAPAISDPAWSGSSSMLGGTARYDGGEWIYQDFVYDDYGADVSPAGASQRVTLASTKGDFRYPSDAKYASNAADIAEVRIRPDGADLDVRVTMQSLIQADTTVVGFGIDLGSGEERAWPMGAGVSSVWDIFATAAAGSLWVTDGTTVVHTGSSVVDVAANTIEFTIPGGAASDSITLSGGAGLWDPATQEWLEGAPVSAGGRFSTTGPSLVRVFDLAFNARSLEQRGGAWQEDGQSLALALAATKVFSQRVYVDWLRSGVTDAQITQRGFYNRIFRTRQDLGEGTAGSFPQYRSKLTPYGLWLPEGYDPNEGTPLVFNLHSLSVHHNQYRGGPGSTSYRTFYEQLGDPLGAIVVTPLGGGPDGWYRNESLVDALEVLADVQRHYNIDPDRIYISGYSMGGYGTYRIGMLLADRFAGAVSWAGVPTDGDRLDNWHSVPLMIVHGTGDELVPITGVRAQAARMRALGYEYRFHEHPAADHLSFAFADEWSRELAWLSGRTRAQNPPRVSFKVQPSMWTSGLSPQARETILTHVDALGYDFTSAYWVRGVRNRDESATAHVDVTSLAIADRVPQRTDLGAGVNVVPHSPHVTEGYDVTLGAAPTSNGLEIVLRGTAEVTLTLARARIDPSAPIALATDADDVSTLRLDGGFGAGASVIDDDTNEVVASSVDGGVLSITLPAGTRTLRVLPS